jgi:hypothetical protein
MAPQIAPLSTSKGPGEGGEPHQFYYPDGDADVGVIAYGTPAGANAQIAKLVAGEAAKAIKAKGAFTLVLTGEDADVSATACFPQALHLPRSEDSRLEAPAFHANPIPRGWSL